MTNTTDYTFANMANGSIARTVAMEIPTCQNGSEALRHASIDWEVDTVNLGDILEAPNAKNTTISQRSDTGAVIGVNGKKHRVIQNTVLAEMGDAIIRVEGDAKYVAGGARSGGEMTFLQIELPRTLDLGGGDTINRFITLFTNHNGGKVVSMASSFRPSCANQWGELLKSSQRLTGVSHTASAEMRMREAIFTLEAAVTQFDEWDIALRELLTQPAALAGHLPNIVGPRPDKAGRGLTLWENAHERVWDEYSQDFNQNLIGTGLGVLMAAQGADEHTSACGRGKRDEQRVGRLVTGRYPLGRRAMASLVRA